jgi:hypothetical protein
LPHPVEPLLELQVEDRARERSELHARTLTPRRSCGLTQSPGRK